LLGGSELATIILNLHAAPRTFMSFPPLQETVALPARSAWLRWQVVALLVCFSFMTWFNRVSMSVAYDERIQEQCDISPEAMGYVYSAFLFAYMVFMTPGGWFIDRFGPWAALVLMGLGSGVLGALTAVAGLPALVAAGLVLPLLLVIRSVMGVLSAPVYPGSSRAVSHWVPVDQRAWANGLVQSAAAVGIACAFPVFGALIDWLDWQAAFVVSGTVTGLLALAWMAWGADYPAQTDFANEGEPPNSGVRPAADEVGSDWWALLRNRSLILLTVCYAAVGYVEYLFFFWMHYYFEKVLLLGKTESRVYAAILTLSMAVGMVVGGWAAGRLTRRYGSQIGHTVVPVVGLSAGAALLVLGVLAEQTEWMVTYLALALAAVGAVEAPVWTTAIELGGRHGGTAAGICNTGGNAGGLLAPIITPLVSGWISRQFDLSEQTGWQWGICLGSAIALAGALLWWRIVVPTTPAGWSRHAGRGRGPSNRKPL
jgi:MFS family permease